MVSKGLTTYKNFVVDFSILDYLNVKLIIFFFRHAFQKVLLQEILVNSVKRSQ